jgi:butyryl-CoA dehydrogenase
MATWQNPLVDDRDIEFLLDDVFALSELTKCAYFADHDRDTFVAFIDSARRVARTYLYPAYRAMDATPPELVDGRIRVHPRMRELWTQMVGLGLIAAPRDASVGGQQLPLSIYTLASVYLMAGNLGAYGYAGLTQGAAHLLEAFGSTELRDAYMTKMYSGEWTGTMALTEPQAGSSLSDVATIATPAPDGSYRIRGNKIFISGGDHDIAENVVHMTLARIAGAPAGIKGVSLFCIPRRRLENGVLVDNDVATAGMIHKIGWRGLPSLALSYGEHDDCHGWLVGEPHQGIRYMFQMMNEARLMVGLNGVATASVAYHESLEYARTRPQGRPMTARDPASPQVPITQHPDVRRMLLRQKAIVEGSLALLVRASRHADLAAHGDDRDRHRQLLDLLTPVAKSFPAERGFEANALAVQIHGGYGYSSEYPVEAWLRDQKLNSIHEGTTGIQALDLLGRRATAPALALWREEIATTAARAKAAGVSGGDDIERAAALVSTVTAAQYAHATDYLDAFSTVTIAWQWLELAAAAAERAAKRGEDGFTRTKLAAAHYWLATELPRVPALVELCKDPSYVGLDPDEL